MKYKEFFSNLQTNFDIEKISSRGMKTFFSLYIGLICFIKNEQITSLTNKEFEEELRKSNFDYSVFKKNRFSLIYRINIYKYVLFDSLHRELMFINLHYGIESKLLFIKNIFQYEMIVYDKEYKSINYFDTFGGEFETEEIIKLLLDVSHDNYTVGEQNKAIHFLHNIYNSRKNWMYRFVLGAGVNSGYGMMSWQSLEGAFDNEISHLLDPTDPAIGEKISRKTFNTNYGKFQILKDIESSSYYSILEDLVLPKNTILANGKTMYTIINVLKEQEKKKIKQCILTFNYDSVLEHFLDYKNVKSVFNFKANNKIENKYNFNIIHSHGFLPYENRMLKDEDYYSTIVLTSSEYFDNYKTSRSYGFKNLYKHLDLTCFFIGNSITDYEEQKVISAHFKKHPSQYHFAFFVPDNDMDDKAKLYKTIFMLKIGIIPLWYNSYDEYLDELLRNIGKK